MAQQKKKLVFTVFFIFCLSLAFKLEKPSFAEAITIDQSQINQGLIKVSSNIEGASKIKMTIQYDDKKYVYDLTNDGKVDAFPLQLGDGEYKITVLKNIGGTKYAPLKSETVTLKLSDPNIVFLQSIQNVKWTMSSLAVKKAVSLIEGFKNGTVQIEKIYDFVVSNYRYDYDKAANVQTGYIPVVDDTYVSKKGICYDYSALFAAMLRSNGIPTRLIKGYTVNVDGYHAWNEVYDKSSNSWIVVDTTYDSQIKLLKKKTTLKKPDADYQRINIY